MLGVSDDTVRRWLDAGRLTSDTESGRTIVPADAVVVPPGGMGGAVSPASCEAPGGSPASPPPG